jgi:hypothetical protein
LSADASLERLWGSAPSSAGPFDPSRLAELPAAAQRYLRHAIAAGAPLASSVRLTMHGEIKLKSWNAFEAEEVIQWGRGFAWRATVRFGWGFIRGGDRLIDGAGAMRWKLLGVIPVVSAAGLDVTRSAAGRVNLESIWLPSALCGADVAWTGIDDQHFRGRFSAHGEAADISYAVDSEGRLRSVSMPRWGDPGNRSFGYAICGGVADEERTFGGYTIPTRLRVGWHFGSERFESEGEFFRVTIDDAVFR